MRMLEEERDIKIKKYKTFLRTGGGEGWEVGKVRLGVKRCPSARCYTQGARVPLAVWMGSSDPTACPEPESCPSPMVTS